MSAGDVERGRQLASERDDLIAQGVDPALLEVPIVPPPPPRPPVRAMTRLLCAIGRHRWRLVRIECGNTPGFTVITESCDRPWCRGRTTRKRTAW